MTARIFAASDPRHGKRAGYEAHLRRHETPCEACTRANRERQGAQQPRTEWRAYIVGEVSPPAPFSRNAKHGFSTSRFRSGGVCGVA